VAPTAAVVGDVSLGSKSSVWYNCVVRGEASQQLDPERPMLAACGICPTTVHRADTAGDVQPVAIGEGSNLQDGVYAGSLLLSGHKTVVGKNVSVGHGATLRGCTVGDNCLIGMDCVLQEGAHVSAPAAAGRAAGGAPAAPSQPASPR
jgi:carbonic anhydrase/acetyltransferase-like protein (isoleucine patch superfamily)